MARILAGGVLNGFGMLSVAVFYGRHWRRRDYFNDLGHCFDPVSQDMYLERPGSCGAASLQFSSPAAWRCSFGAREPIGAPFTRLGDRHEAGYALRRLGSI
jgi:hypothetical protein